MINWAVHFLVRWFAFLTIAATLQCCGSGVTQSKNEGLAVNLEVPNGEDPSLFWIGVQQKALKVTPGKGDPVSFPWNGGESRDLDLREGDKIEFFGNDGQGRLLVTGETTVGTEKKATIPLRRVL